MPFIGLGLHVVLALFCALHVVRTGQPLYWLFILFAFPMLGSLVYLFAVYLPNSRLERGAMKAVAAAAKALDPGKAVRQARADFEEAPTAQNQMRLAAALLEAGEAQEAAERYESALKGPFAADPDLRYGAARSFVECQRHADALVHLEALRSSRPDYRPDGVALLMARCYAGTSRAPEARETFERAVRQFDTFEARAEYAIWAAENGEHELAARLKAEIQQAMARWNRHTRELNQATLQRLEAAFSQARG